MMIIILVIDRLTRRNALLDLLQKMKVGDVTDEDSLGISDCEIIV